MPSIYGRSFWYAYLANTALMTAVSLLFRYGDFVHVLGGSALELGWIVGIGSIGSLLVRLSQGVWIDRYGPRPMWLVSLALIVVALIGHLAITRVDRPGVYMARIAYQTGLAGVFGASITSISRRVPAYRMAEMIGMLGTSGFVGIVLGTQLGDLVCRKGTLDRQPIDRLFMIAAALATLSLVAAWAATRDQPPPVARRRLPTLWLVRRYHPGRLMVMGVAMGIGLSLPGTFLRPFTESLGLSTIGTFFGVYCVTAFSVRMVTRRVPDTLGIRPTIVLGMGCLVVSLLSYLVVQRPWQLILPGLAAGSAHALLFPAVVAGCSRRFPSRYRGLGTTLILGAFDLGNLVGMPIAGSIVDGAGRAGLPPYRTLFVVLAALLTLATAHYATGAASGRFHRH